MIFRYFFPKLGGRQAKRFWQYRKELAAKEAFAPDGRPMTPLTLFDFRRPVDRADASQGVATRADETDFWRISDDSVIGGFSSSTAALVQSSECWAKHLARENAPKEEQQGISTAPSLDDDNKKNDIAFDETSPSSPPFEETTEENAETDGGNDTFTPFIRWSGNLDTTLPLSTTAQRSGFCALRSPDFGFDGANLQGYFNGLEIQCRERSPRQWKVQVKVHSIMLDDIFQGTIIFQPPASSAGPSSAMKEDADDDTTRPFETFVIPFEGLRQTSQGRERELGRELTGGIKIDSIGFALMDGVDGAFELDVKSVRAVNIMDDGLTVYEEGMLKERAMGNRWNPF